MEWRPNYERLSHEIENRIEEEKLYGLDEIDGLVDKAVEEENRWLQAQIDDNKAVAPALKKLLKWILEKAKDLGFLGAKVRELSGDTDVEYDGWRIQVVLGQGDSIDSRRELREVLERHLAAITAPDGFVEFDIYPALFD